MLSGWLSPTGEFHPCPYWGHIDLAYELLGDVEKTENTPDEELVKKGWIKLYYSLFLAEEQQIYYNYDICRATEPQKEFLKKWYNEFPDSWGKVGIIELKTLGVLDEEYDENGCLI